MKPIRTVCMAALLAAGAAEAQRVEPTPGPVLLPSLPASARPIPSWPGLHVGSEGLPPADPLALDYYRPDLKLYAGLDLNPYLGIEASLTNANYRPGVHFVGFGPRLAKGIPLGEGGFNLDLVTRMTVPVNDRLEAFGTAGVTARARPGLNTVDPMGSVGARYKLNNKQTATIEVPVTPAASKSLFGTAKAHGASLQLGF